MHNDRLSSREGAAEALGVSVSSVSNYELGLVKAVPVDIVVKMADLYNAPELKAHYCMHDCPIGGCVPLATDVGSVESVFVGLANSLKEDRIKHVLDTMLSIATDGKVREDEKEDLREVIQILSVFQHEAHRVRMLGEANGCI